MKRQRWDIVYGILDLLLAATYVFLFLHLVPSRKTTFTVIALLLSSVLAAGGVGMLIPARWGKRLATFASWLMLAVTAVLILLLVASAAYLHGIYDGIGEAGVVISILAALLAIQVVGLVPALQLAHLRRHHRGVG